MSLVESGRREYHYRGDRRTTPRKVAHFRTAIDMSLKNHNPGCNCCGKVLVWDMGYPTFGAQTGSALAGCSPREFFNTAFRNMEEFDTVVNPEIEIDFASGTPWPGLLGGLYGFSPFGTLPAPAPTPFDPDANVGTEEGDFWTGDIFDYSTVIFNSPLADTDLEPSPNGPSGRTSIGCPDELWTAGGKPSWWNTVHNTLTADLTGTPPNLWPGRVIFVTSFNQSSASDFSGLTLTHHLAQSTFFNQLMQETGMSLRCVRGASFSGTPISVSLNILNPLAQYTDDNGDPAVLSEIAFVGDTAEVSGGTTVGTTSVPCIAHQTKRTVDIVIIAAVNAWSTALFSADQQQRQYQWWKNLVQTSVTPDFSG